VDEGCSLRQQAVGWVDVRLVHRLKVGQAHRPVNLKGGGTSKQMSGSEDYRLQVNRKLETSNIEHRMNLSTFPPALPIAERE
jgi:hypothetical protein